MRRFFLPIFLFPLLALADSVVVSTPETDPLAIHKDGSSVTIAKIPFAEGLSVPADSRIVFGNDLTAANNPSIFRYSTNGAFIIGSGKEDPILGATKTVITGSEGRIDYTGLGGDVEIAGGLSGGWEGGSVRIVGGFDSLGGNGGSVYLDGGASTGGGATGNIFLGASAGDVYLKSLTGVLRADAGLVSAASAGTDYEAPISAGTTAQYWRGDKSWQTLNQAAVAGLTTASSPTFAGLTINPVADLPHINLVGRDTAGTGGDSGGISIFLGYNHPINRQLWIGDPTGLGDEDESFFRYWFEGGVPVVDGVDGTNSINRPFSISPYSPVYLGSTADDETGMQIQVSNGLSVGGGFLLKDGLLTTQTMEIDPTGGTYYTQSARWPTAGASSGKAQFYQSYIPTSGNVVNNTGLVFDSTTDLRAIAPSSSSTQFGNKFVAAYQAFDNNSGFINTDYTGTYFSTSINGNYTSGMRMATASLTAVKNDVAFTGNHGGFGINFFPIVDNIGFSAYTTASHQIIGRNQTLTYNPSSANNTNQLFGFQSAIVFGGTGIVGGHTHPFVGYIQPAGTDTMRNDAAIYHARGVSSGSSAMDTALYSGKSLYMFWGQPGYGGTWAMTNHDTIVFYADLQSNAKNFAFKSSAADGWMAADNSKWIFGAGKDLSLYHNGTDSYVDNITGKLIFKSPTTFEFGSGAAGVDYIIQVNGETNDGVITWMEDEDYFKFGDGIFMDAAEEVFFRATGNKIYSSAADTLDVVSPTINLGGATSNRVNFIAGDGASAPAAGGAAPSPADYFGGDSVMLGDPAEWLEVKINGTTRKIPCY